MEFESALENAYLMERAMVEEAIEKYRKNGGSIPGYYPGPAGSTGSSGDWLDFVKEKWRDTRIKSGEVMWRVAWFYPDQLRSLQGRQVLLDSVRSVTTNESFFAEWQKQTNRLSDLGIIVDPSSSWTIDFFENDFRNI